MIFPFILINIHLRLHRQWCVINGMKENQIVWDMQPFVKENNVNHSWNYRQWCVIKIHPISNECKEINSCVNGKNVKHFWKKVNYTCLHIQPINDVCKDIQSWVNENDSQAWVEWKACAEIRQIIHDVSSLCFLLFRYLFSFMNFQYTKYIHTWLYYSIS